MTELLHCPSCKFTEDKLIDNQKKWSGLSVNNYSTWDNYKPECYKDRLTMQWVIECQNCGMSIIFNEPEGSSIDLWNELPR